MPEIKTSVQRVAEHMDTLRKGGTGFEQMAGWMASVDSRMEAIREGVNKVGRDSNIKDEALTKGFNDLRQEITRGWAAADQTIVGFREDARLLKQRLDALEARPASAVIEFPFWHRCAMAFGVCISVLGALSFVATLFLISARH